MTPFSPNQRFLFYREPTDMRKSFNGLSGIVTNRLKRSPVSGDVFVFLNRRRTHIKLLSWDRNGFVLYYKRLEEGTFEVPLLSPDGVLTWPKLMLMLEGVALQSARFRKRYELPEKVA